MGFCKICTGRKKPGKSVKIIVNLKKDTICPKCVKAFHIKIHKKLKDKKVTIYISRISHAGPSRHSGTRRLLLSLSRDDTNSKREGGWLDMEISGGSDLGCIGNISQSVFNLLMGHVIPNSGCYGILEVA